MKHIFLSLLLLTSMATSAQTYKVDTLIYSGDPLHHINLVMMGDGFTTSQQDRLTTRAASASTAIFTTVPFTQYKPFFNVFIVHAISQDSGIKHKGGLADCGTQPVTIPNTFYRSFFDGINVHRYVDVANKIGMYQSVKSLLPWYDTSKTTNVVPVIICNSPYYGGGENGTSVTCTLDPNTNEILIHELGHSIGGLSDEYSYNGAEGYNCQSKWNGASFLNWKYWPDAGTYATPGNGIHPYPDCKMNHLGQPFCKICVQQLVRAFTYLVNPISAGLPANTSISLVPGSQQTFSINCTLDNPNTLEAIWTLDGTPISTGFSYILQNDLITPGGHSLQCWVQDGNTSSKTVMNRYNRQWTVVIAQKSITNKVDLTKYPAFTIPTTQLIGSILSANPDNYRIYTTWPAIAIPPGYTQVWYTLQLSTDGVNFSYYNTYITTTSVTTTRLATKTKYWIRMQVAYYNGSSTTFGNFSPAQIFTTK